MLSLQATGVDAKGFARMNAAAAQSSRTFRDAAASTGMFEVQQLRLNSATDDYVKKLRAQKMGFREMSKQRKIAAAAYKEQLAMENMSIRQGVASTRHNKGIYDTIIPTDVSKQLDTSRKRLAFMNAELKSGAHQMVNWGKNTQWAGRQLMVGFTMPIAAFGAAAGVMAYQVDKELTRIQKVIDTTATTTIGIEKELAQVRVDGLKTATKAAQEFGQSATDTLNVQAELAATGKTGVELQKSTLEVMRIARLGEVEHQTAIDATIALQSVFRMSNQELSESFDYMNSIENATSLSTKDFATAIPVAASAVKAFGGDVKEMGILLTAMKENGIGASEGANALKATMQRLGRPSKQIREEWQALTGTDITQLVDESDGLVEVFTKINAATEGIDKNARRKAFAGLFGSYQVSKMMALTKGMGELQDGVGQVSAAYDISNQDAQDWADTAEKEMNRYQKSISGMWDIAFQSMKIELAEIGEPFVVLATKIVTAVSGILKAFNGMPDFAKKFIAGGIAIAALSGGVLMLAGLMGNLAGNILKGIGNLAGLALKLDIVDKETKAAQLATELATNSYVEQGRAIDLLTMKLNAMTAAQQESTMAMLRSNPAYQGAPVGADMDTMIAYGQRDTLLAKQSKVGADGRTRYKTLDPDLKDSAGRKQVYVSKAIAEAEADKFIMASRNADLADAELKNSKVAADIDEKRVKTAGRRNKMLQAGGVLMAAEAAAMTAMMVSDNEKVDQAAQIAMVAGIAAPAASMAASGVMSLADKFKSTADDSAVAAKNSKTLASSTKAAATAAVTAGRGLLTMLGPVGLAVAGITALLGVAAYAGKKDKEMLEARLKDQKELNDLAKDYAAYAGVAYENYKSLQNVMLGIKNEEEANELNNAVKFYEEDAGGKEKVSAFKNLDSDEDKQALGMQTFIDLQARAGMTAGDAAVAVKALYLTAGESAEEAATAVDHLMREIGTLDGYDWDKIIGEKSASVMLEINSEDSFKSWKEESQYIEDETKKMAGMFSQAMSEAANPEEAQAIMLRFQSTALSGWETLWAENVMTSERAMAELKNLGIENAQGLSEFYKNASDAEIVAFEENAGFTMGGLTSEEFAGNLMRAEAIHNGVVDSYVKDYGKLGSSVNTIGEVMDDFNLRLKTMNTKEAGDEIRHLMTAMQPSGTQPALISEEMGLAQMNAILAANNLEEAGSAAEALYIWTHKARFAIEGAKGGAGGLKGELQSAIGPARTLAQALKNLSREQVLAAKRESIEGMQSEMVDNMTSQMDANHEAAQSANDTYWDNEMDAQDSRFDAQSDALDQRHEREQRGFEAAWDAKRKGLENYWDARIEGVDKAIEAEEKAEDKRVKMFDAEIARINRLADMANTNIDFNVALNEGNLDEAAKIANSARAEDEEFIMNREKDAGSEKSSKRVDKLGKKSEALGEQKDAAMEAFEKREEAAKAHFDRMQEMQKANLQKEQDNKKKSLQVEADLSKEALEKDHERQKKNLERVLDTFLSFTPRNKKELQKHAAELGAALKDFGLNTLNPMSQKWGEWYKKNISEGMINAANVSASDSAWAALGKKAKQDILIELGFATEADFDNFIKTGKLGNSAVGSTPRGYGSEASDYGTPPKTGPQTAKKIKHKGGPISGGVDSRKGVAKNYKGLHPSEVEVTARKGEYIINEDAAQKHRGILDQINQGRFVGVGGATGPGGYMTAVLMSAMLKGVGKGLAAKKNAKAARKAQRAASAASMGGQGGFAAGNYVAGQGGWQRPAPPGFGWRNTHDYSAGTGTPVYAASDGVITKSTYITSGGSPGNGGIAPNGQPYRSYGETMQLRMADGNLLNYAHLSARYAGAGQEVRGGSLIGRTGNTGNSTGPHLHMDIGGNYNASGYLASRGIGLRKGAQYVKFDNTMANLHRGESVLTKNLTEKMHQGVDRFAKGDSSEYNVEVNINGYNGDADALADLVVKKIQRGIARRPQSRSV